MNTAGKNGQCEKIEKEERIQFEMRDDGGDDIRMSDQGRKMDRK